jgi:hypothetical protein
LFPRSEPVIQDDHMRNYDLTLLTDTPATSSSSDAGNSGYDTAAPDLGSPRTPSSSVASDHAVSPAAAEISSAMDTRQPASDVRILPPRHPQL